MVAWLVEEHSADVAIRDTIGWNTPLHLASTSGHMDLASWLVTKGGADPTARDGNHRQLIHDSCVHGHTELVLLLITDLGSWGTDVNARVFDGRTPLHIACQYGHTDIIRLLITGKAALHATTAQWECN